MPIAWMTVQILNGQEKPLFTILWSIAFLPYRKQWWTVQDVEDIYGGTLKGILEHLDQHSKNWARNTLYLSTVIFM
jgi:hypothetical protein